MYVLQRHEHIQIIHNITYNNVGQLTSYLANDHMNFIIFIISNDFQI